MGKGQALLDCTFGWGKTCRLYLDVLEIAGKSYNLEDLTAVYPTYRNIFGVPSARLELSFGQQHLVLRGIPDVEAARLLVSQLQPYCSAEPRPARVRSRASRDRATVREQARTWERTQKIPAIPRSPEKQALSQPTPRSFDEFSDELFTERLLARAEDETLAQSRDEPLLVELPRSLADALPERETSRLLDDEPLDRETARLLDDLVPDTAIARPAGARPRPAEPSPLSDNRFQVPASSFERTDAWPVPPSQPLHTPRFQPPLHSVHLVAPGQKRRYANSLPLPAVKSSALPIIHVPVRLQPGECAHYSIGAALCSDRLSGSDHASYPALDHGLLILTNRRIFYVGKRAQLILAYTHLWYVSLLQDAVALHVEQQFRRIVIELEHPQEWAGRIEQLAFIARRSCPRPELPTLLMTALPGMQSAGLNAPTLKRPAIKIPPAKVQAVKENTEPPPEVVEAKTVEEEAKPLEEQSEQVPALPDVETQQLRPEPALADAMTQELHPVARDESADYPQDDDETRALKTSGLLSPAVCDNRCDEIETMPLPCQPALEEDEQTLLLRKRHRTRARTGMRNEPTSDRLPDLDITDHRLPRVLRSRMPAPVKK